MFTRVSVLSLGVGLVLVGCASPTDEATDDTNEQGVAPTTEATPSDGTQATTEDATPTEEGNVASKSDAIIVGPGLGWGGWGAGMGMWGRPFVGVPGWGWGGGLYRGVGWGTGLGWGGGLYRGFGWGGAGCVGCGFGWGGNLNGGWNYPGPF